MKKILNICLTAALAVTLFSCEKEDHAIDQRVTYYPVFSLEKGSPYACQVGKPFVDPGYSAILNGSDITSDIMIEGEVDGTTSGIYNLTYSYTNSDGFVSETKRMVVVYDIANAGTADISGTYSDTNTSVFTADGTLSRNYNAHYGGYNYSEKITKGPAKGLFYIEDLMSGLYPYYAGYGNNYAYKAFVLLNSDNTINILNGNDIDPWDTPIIDCTTQDSTYDPATGDVVIKWHMGDTKIYVTTYKK